ncbi:MAG: hypothetical protein QNJ19_09320 [Woeseiaceae bacterium]|nr:hypothetical protein [Woeseiaceae bacterium]
MNAKILYVCATSLALGTAMLCASPEASASKRLEVLPMTSIVRPYKLEDDAYNWKVVVQSHLDGEPVHDTVFRRPTGPTEAVQVDCSQTQSIGVYFEVKSESKHKNMMRPFRFSWSHNDIDPEEPVRSDFKGAWLLPKVQGVMLFSDHLKLTDARRKNGEWKLRVYHMGEEIFREEFNLMFCDRPYAPRWYRDGAAATTTAAVGAAAITVSGFSEVSATGDPLIDEIDATIESIDSSLNDYIREYLEMVQLPDTEFRSIERKLERTVKAEREDNPATFNQVPEDIHLLQVKIRFLRSAHPAFEGKQIPESVGGKFAKLGELEERLRQEEAEAAQQ